MSRLALIAVVTLLGGVSADAAEERWPKRDSTAFQALFRAWDFDTVPAGEAPPGFTPARAGATDTGALWMVKEDPAAPSPPNVLVQSAPCMQPGCLQLLLANGLVYDYPDLSARLRLTPGATPGSHAAGGLVFGARDAGNFYAALVSASGDAVEVIRVRAGTPTVLAQQAVTPKKIVWHHLRVQRNTIISKEYIEVFLDGALVLSFEDKLLEAGQIGLITRDDALIGFDHLHAAPLYSQRPLSPPAAY